MLPPLNRSHPLARGLRVFALFDAGGFAAGSMTHTGTPWGRGLAAAAVTGTNGAALTIPDSVFTAAQGSAVAFGGRIAATSNYQYFAYKGSTLTTAQPFAVRTADGTSGATAGAVTPIRANGSGFRLWHSATATMTAGRWHVVAASFANDQIETSAVVSVDGVTSSTAALLGTGSGTVTANASTMYVGSRPDNTGEASTIDVGWWAAWGRPLTELEHAMLAADPFVVLADRSVRSFARRSFIPPAPPVFPLRRRYSLTKAS